MGRAREREKENRAEQMKRIQKILDQKYPGWKICKVEKHYDSIFSRRGGVFYHIKYEWLVGCVVVPTRKYLYLKFGLDFANKSWKKLDYYVDSARANAINFGQPIK